MPLSTISDTSVIAEGYTDATGYMISPKDYAVIKEPSIFVECVKNAETIVFEIKRSETDTNPIILAAAKGNDGLYRAEVTTDILARIGETDTATITLKGDSVAISSSRFISFNKDKDTMPVYVIEDFEYYFGNNDLLANTYGTPNSAADCNSSIELSASNKFEGLSKDGKGNKTIYMTIGQPLPEGLGIPEIIINRTFVPIRYVAEQLDANVIWDEQTNAISIYQ